MPSEINRNPRGAVELTDLNRQGLFPRVLGDEIQPTLETAPFYYAGRGLEYSLVTTTAIILAGQVATIAVPAGQTWAVRGVSMRMSNLDAANATNFSMSILAFAVPGSFFTLDRSDVGRTVLPLNFAQLGKTFENPILLPGGTTLSYNVDCMSAIGVTGHTVFSSVAFYRLGL